jgi:hypothetical protein
MKNLKKMKIVYGFFASCFLSLLLFSSCKKGDTGLQGTSGTTGATGTTGASGNTILSGDAAPSMMIGNIGDFYLELDSAKLYGPKTSAGWGSPVSLMGAPGATGATGATGDSGATGAAGAAGPGAQADTFSVNTADWTVGGYAYAEFTNNSAYPFATQYFNRPEPNITQGILDSGMVLVYFTADRPFNATQWLPIPYTIPEYANTNSGQLLLDYNWSYLTTVGQLKLQFYLTPLSKPTEDYPAVSSITVPNAAYKVVVVPATITQEITSITKKRINLKGQIIN